MFVICIYIYIYREREREREREIGVVFVWRQQDGLTLFLIGVVFIAWLCSK